MKIKQRLARVFDNQRFDAIILMNTDRQDSNLTYLTGLNGVYEQSIAIASPHGVDFLTSELEYYTAQQGSPKGVRVIEMGSGRQISRMLAEYKGETIGINSAFLPYYYYKYIRKHSGAKRIVDASAALARARAIKSDEEIRKIRIANKIAKKAFSQISNYFKQGVTERQIAAAFDNLMRNNGADQPSFPTIVAFGANTAMPHHMPGNAKLKPNSLVIIDAGAKHDAYCSDITRTFIYKPDKNSAKFMHMADMVETVRQAQQLAFKKIKPGAVCGLIHNTAADYINSANNGTYKNRFIHALGHSIGIDVHDPGFSVSPGSETKLRQGMVFSNEPGIYLEGFGGVRIEDDVVVTKSGAAVL